MKRMILVLVTALTTWSSVSAAKSACTHIKGGMIQQPDGSLAGGELLISDGRIVNVGPTLSATPGCVILDVTHKVVTAGLIHPMSQLGLVEVELEAYSVDSRHDAEPTQVHASFVVADAYNPQASAVKVSVLGGVTSAVIVPQGGIVSGQSGWVDLDGQTQAETVKTRRLALHARVGGQKGSRATSLHRLRALFDEARVFARHRADWEKKRFRDFRFAVRDLEAVIEVLVQRQPLIIAANRASDIEAAMRFAEDYGVRLIVKGAAEGWRHRDALASAGVAVIVDPILNGPEGFDALGARADNAALLAEAGVSVILTAARFGSHNLRKLRQAAGNAVRAGLPHATALNAITRHVADAYGVSDYGRLSAGAVGNIVVWSGDPLELSTKVEHVIIGGKVVPLKSRQTMLRERYRVLPGTPAPALPLP